MIDLSLNTIQNLFFQQIKNVTLKTGDLNGQERQKVNSVL